MISLIITHLAHTLMLFYSYYIFLVLALYLNSLP